MSDLKKLLDTTHHRPYEIPKESWQFYHQWKDILFLHWPIPKDILRPHVPDNLSLDTFQGQCYISYVIFSMRDIRPKNLFPFSPISDFHEINVRTYINLDGKAGVYFINIEAEKAISAFIARQLSGLPYEYAKILRTNNSCISKNKNKNFSVDITYEIGEKILQKSELDIWLTERYCLYQVTREKMYRCDIQHEAWNLKNIKISALRLNYHFGDFTLGHTPFSSAHYSDCLEVLSWPKVEVLSI